jgi:hypothetical protein
MFTTASVEPGQLLFVSQPLAAVPLRIGASAAGACAHWCCACRAGGACERAHTAAEIGADPWLLIRWSSPRVF